VVLAVPLEHRCVGQADSCLWHARPSLLAHSCSPTCCRGLQPHRQVHNRNNMELPASCCCVPCFFVLTSVVSLACFFAAMGFSGSSPSSWLQVRASMRTCRHGSPTQHTGCQVFLVAAVCARCICCSPAHMHVHEGTA
jgi:hypothetical protein